jgi:hypothetical protein
MTGHHLDRHSRLSSTDDRPPRVDRTSRAEEAITLQHSRINQVGSVNEPEHYEIRVKGHLSPRWTEWFDDMTFTARDDGTTVIQGPVADQSELHGLLRRLGDLGLPLISVTTQATDRPTRKGARHDHH